MTADTISTTAPTTNNPVPIIPSATHTLSRMRIPQLKVRGVIINPPTIIPANEPRPFAFIKPR
jgi:hypothetical protein